MHMLGNAVPPLRRQPHHRGRGRRYETGTNNEHTEALRLACAHAAMGNYPQNISAARGVYIDRRAVSGANPSNAVLGGDRETTYRNGITTGARPENGYGQHGGVSRAEFDWLKRTKRLLRLPGRGAKC